MINMLDQLDLEESFLARQKISKKFLIHFLCIFLFLFSIFCELLEFSNANFHGVEQLFFIILRLIFKTKYICVCAHHIPFQYTIPKQNDKVAKYML